MSERDDELERLRRELREVTDKYQRAYAELVLHTEGIFTRAEYLTLWKCLHPDRIQDEAERKLYTEAAAIFSRCEKLVKKEPPPKRSKRPLPRTFEELMEGRRQVKERNSQRSKAAWAKRKSKGRLLRDDRT